VLIFVTTHDAAHIHRCDESSTRGALTQLQRTLLALHARLAAPSSSPITNAPVAALRAFRGQLLKECVVSVRNAPVTAAAAPPHPSTVAGRYVYPTERPFGTYIPLPNPNPEVRVSLRPNLTLALTLPWPYPCLS